MPEHLSDGSIHPLPRFTFSDLKLDSDYENDTRYPVTSLTTMTNLETKYPSVPIGVEIMTCPNGHVPGPRYIYDGLDQQGQGIVFVYEMFVFRSHCGRILGKVPVRLYRIRLYHFGTTSGSGPTPIRVLSQCIIGCDFSIRNDQIHGREVFVTRFDSRPSRGESAAEKPLSLWRYEYGTDH